MAEDADVRALAQRFRRFAEIECRRVSPLYERLSLGTADDPDLLALAAHARSGQPAPNLFLAAVHFLLLNGAQHRLSAYYPSVSGGSPPSDDPWPAFRSFCDEHAANIQRLVSTRLVQTNEVRRSACLLPAFGLVASQSGDGPLALVEIGASAGLNLLWDRYGYDYGLGAAYGNPCSPVQLVCILRGPNRPPIPGELPSVASRLGLDLNPVDVRNPDSALWLRALVWPEHAARARLLQRAIDLARQDPPRLIGGNALEVLPGVLATAPAHAVVCVFHTYTANQLTPEERQRLSTLLAEHAARRDLFRISIEWVDAQRPTLEITCFQAGAAITRTLAYCEPHGEWLEWLQQTPSALGRGSG